MRAKVQTFKRGCNTVVPRRLRTFLLFSLCFKALSTIYLQVGNFSKWIVLADNLCASLRKIGDLVTISFDYYGDCTVGGWNLSKESFVRCEGSGDVHLISHTGRVKFTAHDKYHRVWVTYKLTQGEGPRFFLAINTNANGGTLHIRNIKVELSDHPTDYEGILEIGDLGGNS